MLLTAEARSLHRACAESLQGRVLTSQLALHHEGAGPSSPTKARLGLQRALP